MTTVIRHVRHLWLGDQEPDWRIWVTVCGQRFKPYARPRDWQVHDPATSRCARCHA